MQSQTDTLLERRSRELVNIGHRGASAYAPENTIAAYDLALAQGAHYIELDLHVTRDQHLVVVHDATVDRTARSGDASVAGTIASKTLAELRALDVGSWFYQARGRVNGEPGGALRMPTLDEVLARYRHLARLCIELKARGAERRLVETLERHGLAGSRQAWGRVLVMSFNTSSLVGVRQLDARLPLVQIYRRSHTSEDIRSQIDEVATYSHAIAPYRRAVDPALVGAAHGRGLLVHPYTVNGGREMSRLLDVGVDGMITDHPDRLDALVRTRAQLPR